MKIGIYAITGLLFCLLFIFQSQENCFAQQTFREGHKFISTSNPSNPSVRFYYYLPKDVLLNPGKSHNVLVFVPGLNGDEKGFIRDSVKNFAQNNNMIIITPKFVNNHSDFQQGKSYQYPSVWSGKALVDLLNKFNSSGIKTNKLFMFGFSAGAQYVLRFALWKPSLVKACMAHAPGSTIKPSKRVSVKFFNTVGENDGDRVLVHKQFVDAATAVGMRVKSKVYKGLGHHLDNTQFADCLSFFSSYAH